MTNLEKLKQELCDTINNKFTIEDFVQLGSDNLFFKKYIYTYLSCEECKKKYGCENGYQKCLDKFKAWGEEQYE